MLAARKSVQNCYIRFALAVGCGSRLCTFTMQMRKDFFHFALSQRKKLSFWKTEKNIIVYICCSPVVLPSLINSLFTKEFYSYIKLNI